MRLLGIIGGMGKIWGDGMFCQFCLTFFKTLPVVRDLDLETSSGSVALDPLSGPRHAGGDDGCASTSPRHAAQSAGV